MFRHGDAGRAAKGEQRMAELREPEPELLWENEVIVDPAHLQPGHFVARLDLPWIDSPFPLAGLMIARESQLEWLREHCAWVIVDLLRSQNRFIPPRGRLADRARARPAEPVWKLSASDPNVALHALRRAPLDRCSVPESVEAHRFLTDQAETMILAVSKSGRIDARRARAGIRSVARRLKRNLAAMVWLTRIKHADRYTAEHCVNVAVLAMGLAGALDWPPEDVERAGLAGLLHDLGKLRIDPQVLNKPGRLTGEEYEQVKKHAMFGYEMLRSEPDLHPKITRAVLEHHERPDGTGYPFGHPRGSLQSLSSLVSVVDAYDAITSKRPYSPARSHHEALGILWKARGSQFDGDMVEALIRFLGWVTPGTLVRLSSEQFAVVLRARDEHRLWPRVRLLDSENDHQPGRVLDLAEHNKRNPDRMVRVVEVLADDALKVDLRGLLEHQGRAGPDPEEN